MTMFPAINPEMPPEITGPIMDNPQGFADAMGPGVDAFTAALEGGGSMEDAFDAFSDVSGPLMEDIGIPQDVFDGIGNMLGATAGPAIMMGPADADGGDIGAMLTDALEMMMPDGMTMPPEVADAMMDFGAAIGDAGLLPHDVADELMAPPGEPGYPMPMDADGNPVMVPGDPASVPMTDMNGEPILQPPLADGAMADLGTMMPPEGGYDHPPMDGDMTMPPPMNMDIAMMGPNDTLESMGMNPDGSGGPYEMGTMDMGGSNDDVPSGADTPVSDLADAMGGDSNVPSGADTPVSDLAGAMGGDSNLAQPTPEALAADAMDSAMASAMDGAMDQGGPAGGQATPDPTGELSGAENIAQTEDVDPSAGMG
jgi:hypothetical protein